MMVAEVSPCCCELVCFSLGLHGSPTGVQGEVIFHAYLASPDCHHGS